MLTNYLASQAKPLDPPVRMHQIVVIGDPWAYDSHKALPIKKEKHKVDGHT